MTRLPARTPRKRRGGPARLRLEKLEDRTLPSVSVLSRFFGMSLNDTTCNCEPPDTIAAAGPHHVVEMVNTAIRIIDKSTNATISTQEISSFFAPLNPVEMSDPNVFFDETVDNGPGQDKGRWVVGILDFDFFAGTSNFDFAVSNDADPTHGFSDMHQIDLSEGLTQFADYPRFGFNGDAYVYTFNDFLGGFSFDKVRVLSIAKSSVLDKNPGTFTANQFDSPNSTDHTLTPALMHDAGPGGPMYFAESDNFGGSGNSIRVVKMTNVLSPTPTFTTYNVGVNAYNAPPDATQPGGGFIATNDSRVLQAAERGGHLVATHAIGVGSRALARWYDFDLTTPTPTVAQQGQIDPGAGINTFFPSIDIAPDGSYGMTYMESSPSIFMSTYVTGRLPTDPLGAMQVGALVEAGNAHYSGSRAGDFSGLSVDPTDGTFWGANEVRTTAAFWGTAIGHFKVSPPAGPTIVSSFPSGAAGANPISSVSFTFNTAMDTTSFSLAADVDSFSGPGGANLLGQLTGYSWSSNQKTLTVTFAAQSLPGSYRMVIGPNILDTSGHAMDQNGNGVAGEPTDTYTDNFSISASRIIEDFEALNALSRYRIALGTAPTAAVATSARHDGARGLRDTGGNDWIYRTDSNAIVRAGDAVSAWVQLNFAADGRAYFGFGASSSGTMSVVLAANTSQLIIQDNSFFRFFDVASVPMTFVPNHWYRVEVDWASTGGVTAQLFDSDGTTLLTRVTALAQSLPGIASGGIAFRATGNPKFWDTVVLTPGGGNLLVGSPASGLSGASLDRANVLANNHVPPEPPLPYEIARRLVEPPDGPIQNNLGTGDAGKPPDRPGIPRAVRAERGAAAPAPVVPPAAFGANFIEARPGGGLFGADLLRALQPPTTSGGRAAGLGVGSFGVPVQAPAGALAALTPALADAYFAEEATVWATAEEHELGAPRIETAEAAPDAPTAVAGAAVLLGGYWARTGEGAGRTRQRVQRPR